MREIALHLLDIAENSVAAQARNITILILEDLDADRLEAVVSDDGKGMDAELLARVTDPFVTSRTTRKVGLGIPLLKAAAEACQGGLVIESTPGKGTTLKVEFQHSHIDRMPLGDVASTLLTLVIGAPHIHWVLDYRQRANGAEKVFCFDNQPIQAALGDISLTEPDILAYIRTLIEEGVASVQNTLQEIS